jgi:hypothetical protein
LDQCFGGREQVGKHHAQTKSQSLTPIQQKTIKL